ncbi:uncharacterized protein LOC107360171 isoform X1 [Tetranychus urticae]|uniref:F-box domain-containing protein n=1 Tax=Tetranychus urticae TaxID=32264 RepID=T1JRT2_TETUR|nr:uncharacterized protein LOC107360171 isoform X1 [Tetranychus urticae]
MLINELLDDCLLTIFGFINELDDLVNCYKVCNKWSQLINERTRKVKYLVEHNDRRHYGPFPNYPFDIVYYRTEEPVDGTCLSILFPNLMIADFSAVIRKKVKHEEIATFVKNIKSCKGLIYRHEHNYLREELIFQYCDELEMVSTNYYIDHYIAKKDVNIKQLQLWNCKLDKFTKNAHNFPNLERLHIDYGATDGYYNGLKLRKLKILELYVVPNEYGGIYYGFKFMDSFPNLQSAHIYLRFHHIFVDESCKHESLRDLVLEFYLSDYDSFNWNEFRSLFMKYPNLKHLALRSFKNLKNEHVEQLVRILPNLVLFVVCECPKVTQEAAHYIQDYNRLHGRTIKFYFDDNYHDIQSDWPYLSTKREKISQGFDFMKNCFLKDFRSLSTFLIPNEN